MISLKRFRLIAVLLVFCLVFEVPGQALAKSYKGKYVDITPLFKKPKQSDMWLSAGIMAASCILPAAFSSAGTVGSATSSFGMGAFTSGVSQMATHVAATKWGFNADAAQVFGYGVSGALTGFSTALNDKTAYLSKHGTVNSNWWNSRSPYARGIMVGALKGSAVGGANLLVYNSLKDTGFYKNDPFFANQVSALAGSAIGHLGSSFVIGDVLHVKTTADINMKDKDQWRGKSSAEWKANGAQKVVYNNGETYLRIPDSAFSDGALSSTRLAFVDPSFISSMVSQSVGLGIEYAAYKGALGGDLKKNMYYTRALGSSIGGMAGARSIGGSMWAGLGNGILSGGLSAALNGMGGEYNPSTGINRWGMTKTQMAGVTLAGSYLARGLLAENGWKKGLIDSAYNQTSFGGTSPFSTAGAGGYTEAKYIENLAQYSGYANFKANTDYLRGLYGKDNKKISWNEFVKEGGLSNVYIQPDQALTRYVTSTMHYSAVDNLTAAVTGIVSATGNGVKSWFTKVKKEQGQIFAMSPKKFSDLNKGDKYELPVYNDKNEQTATMPVTVKEIVKDDSGEIVSFELPDGSIKDLRSAGSGDWPVYFRHSDIPVENLTPVRSKEEEIARRQKQYGGIDSALVMYESDEAVAFRNSRVIEEILGKDAILGNAVVLVKPKKDEQALAEPSQILKFGPEGQLVFKPNQGETREESCLLYKRPEDKKDVKDNNVKYLAAQVNDELLDNRHSRPISKVIQDIARGMDDIVVNGKTIEEGDAYKGVSLWGANGLVSQVKPYLDEKFQKEIDKTTRSVGTGKTTGGRGAGKGKSGIGKQTPDILKEMTQSVNTIEEAYKVHGLPGSFSASNPTVGPLASALPSGAINNVSSGNPPMVVNQVLGKKYTFYDDENGIRKVALIGADGKPGDFYPLWRYNRGDWALDVNGPKNIPISTEAVAQILGYVNPKWGDEVRTGKIETSSLYGVYNPATNMKYTFNKFQEKAVSGSGVNIGMGCSTPASASSCIGLSYNPAQVSNMPKSNVVVDDATKAIIQNLMSTEQGKPLQK